MSATVILWPGPPPAAPTTDHPKGVPMDAVMTKAESPRAGLARAKARDYAAIFWTSYPLFLVVALIARLEPGGETWCPRHGLNVFKDAREMAHTIIPFAFMH